jgi:hypothetical protein
MLHFLLVKIQSLDPQTAPGLQKHQSSLVELPQSKEKEEPELPANIDKNTMATFQKTFPDHRNEKLITGT